MAGVGCKALNSYQIVAGVDWHLQIPPPPPAGPVPAPHAIAYCIGWAIPAPGKKALTVWAGWGNALGRQHDIGIGAYHFAANCLLPLVWLGAGNKAEFGSSSVRIPTGRMAVALIPVLGVNLQLDCNVPCPLPTSICLASFNTVEAGFTLADLVAGFAAMLCDIAITYINSKVTGILSKGMGAGLVKGLEAVAGVQGLLVAGVVSAAFPKVTALVKGTFELLVGWALGSPLGYSPEWAPGSKYGGMANDAVNDWISPDPVPPPATGACAAGPASGGGSAGPAKPPGASSDSRHSSSSGESQPSPSPGPPSRPSGPEDD